MDEFDLITRYFRPLSAEYQGALALTDDAALLEAPAGEQLVVTKDAIVAGVHFIGNEDAALIAAKLLRVNLSDLAAKGAKPLRYFLAAMLPAQTDEAWVARFAAGMSEEQQRFGIHLAGGDTTRTAGPLALSLTAIGTVPTGTMLRRSGAKAGDAVYVTGTLGDSAEGLARLKERRVAENDPFVLRYLLPEPRLAVGMRLRGVANACMDISDGLVQDLGHIATTSAVAAILDADVVPRRPGVTREQALSGGDDYELLFTCPPAREPELQAISRDCAATILRVGRIEAGSGVSVVDQSGKAIPLHHTGYRHFSDKH